MGKFADWRKRRAQKKSTVINNVVVGDLRHSNGLPVTSPGEYSGPYTTYGDLVPSTVSAPEVDCGPGTVATSYPTDHIEVCEPVHVDAVTSYSEPGHSDYSGSSYDSGSSSSSSYDSGSSYSSSSYDSGSSSSYDSGSSYSG